MCVWCVCARACDMQSESIFIIVFPRVVSSSRSLHPKRFNYQTTERTTSHPPPHAYLTAVVYLLYSFAQYKTVERAVF